MTKSQGQLKLSQPPTEIGMTPEDVILRLTRNGYSIASLICGLAVTKDGRIVTKTIGEFVSDEVKYRSLYFQFQQYLKQNGITEQP